MTNEEKRPYECLREMANLQRQVGLGLGFMSVVNLDSEVPSALRASAAMIINEIQALEDARKLLTEGKTREGEGR